MAVIDLQLSAASLIAVLVLVFTLTSYAMLTWPSKVPATVSWVGKPGGLLPELRAKIKSLTQTIPILEEGYHKFSKNGLPFILPTGTGPYTLLPRSSSRWIIDQPDHVLSFEEETASILQTKYTFLDPDITKKPLHVHTLKRALTRNLGSLVPVVIEELGEALDSSWGMKTEEWKEVCPFVDTMRISSRASNRVFVGLPLCRNEEYLTNAEAFAGDIGISSLVIRLIPDFLKPLLVWIPLIPNKQHFAKCAKHLKPFVSQRLADMNADKEVPNDFTTWLIKDLQEQGEIQELNPLKLSLRLMNLNFATIHTSTFTATNLLFDLFSTPPEAGFVEGIREEVQTLLAENGGKWDKNIVAKMYKADSALRESLRISTFMTHGLNRKVAVPGGVTTDEGLHIPQGMTVGMPVWSIHHDDAVYPNAHTYDAFRFSSPREKLASTEKNDRSTVLESKNMATVTTSDSFVAFGHGRHACPGRFFAATEMKMLLGYIVMNYDIKPLATRPPNLSIAGNMLPPMKEKILVRRREA